MDTPRTIPDFIIAGAMKCGTTWLHDALNAVDGVYVPREEIHWIDAADPLSHPDFQTIERSGLRLRCPAQTIWFTNPYPQAKSAKLFGYDSTTLFHAHVDFDALAASLPQTRLIVVLRDPVARAYSHYWHLVRTGRARWRFEREILSGRQEILTRSLYRASAERMIAAFRERVLFVCYERMFKEPRLELGRIAMFLGLPDNAVERMLGHLHKRSNPGRYPRFLGGWLLGSRLLAGLESNRYAAELRARDAAIGRRALVILYWLKIGCMVALAGGFRRSAPRLSPQTRDELGGFFATANRGIEVLTDLPFYRYWSAL